jgi:hypothetical protein
VKNSPDYEICNLILRRGNKPGIITEWFAGMKAWAEVNPGKDAEALRLWLDVVKPRPFYTAAELCGLWPALTLSLGLAKTMLAKPTPNRLHNVLQFHGLPILKNVDGSNYFKGYGSYFIVERPHYWKDRPLHWSDLVAVLNGGELK